MRARPHASSPNPNVRPAPRPRRRRAVASAFIALLAFSFSSRLTDVRSAEAGQRAGTFLVSTKTQAGCTFVIGNLVFPNYTSGQAAIDNGTGNYVISCASALLGLPIPLTYTITVPVGFQLANGTSKLNYRLCFDPGCTQPISNGIGTALLVDRTTYSQPYYGQILANQVAPVGAYSQNVVATIIF